MCEFGFINSLYGGTSSFYKIFLFLVSVTLGDMERTSMNIFVLFMNVQKISVIYVCEKM